MKGNQWETRERKENKGKPMENERRTCSKNICCLSRYVSVSYYGFIVSFLLLCLCLCVCLSVRLSARVWEVSLYLSRSLCVSVSLFLLVSVLFVSLICFLLSVCPVDRHMCACIFVCVFLFSFFGSLYLPPFVSVFPTGDLNPSKMSEHFCITSERLSAYTLPSTWNGLLPASTLPSCNAPLLQQNTT